MERRHQIAVPNGIPWISGKRQPPSEIIIYIHMCRVYIYIYRYILSISIYIYYVYLYILCIYQYVPHKAVAEVTKIVNL